MSLHLENLKEEELFTLLAMRVNDMRSALQLLGLSGDYSIGVPERELDHLLVAARRHMVQTSGPASPHLVVSGVKIWRLIKMTSKSVNVSPAQDETARLEETKAELLAALRDLCICVSPMSGGTAQMDKLITAYTKACKAVGKAQAQS